MLGQGRRGDSLEPPAVTVRTVQARDAPGQPAQSREPGGLTNMPSPKQVSQEICSPFHRGSLFAQAPRGESDYKSRRLESLFDNPI